MCRHLAFFEPFTRRVLHGRRQDRVSSSPRHSFSLLVGDHPVSPLSQTRNSPLP
jgi:hypothetical protein